MIKKMIAVALWLILIAVLITPKPEILNPHEIYAKLWAQTGQIQDYIPLEIIDSPIENAYCLKNKIVLYTGYIKLMKNADELARTLGHEIAHVTLGHTSMTEQEYEELSPVYEANADKMGAIYIMKAGYDICKAREFWKRMRIREGNYQGLSHPNYSYRFDELNINCGD